MARERQLTIVVDFYDDSDDVNILHGLNMGENRGILELSAKTAIEGMALPEFLDIDNISMQWDDEKED